MDRLVRLAELWDWLPVFRAVAETEHVHRAATRLDTSASAVSRTVKLLESAVGAPLFHRIGRAMKLTDLGRELLDATRNAMRLVDGAIAKASTGSAAGALRIGATSPETRHLAALAAARSMEQRPGLVPQVRSVAEDEVAGALLRGDLDIGITAHPSPQETLEVERLGTSTYGIYASERHPLAKRKAVALADVIEHPFVAPLGSRWADRWPPDVRRRIGALADELDVALTFVTSQAMLVVIEDRVARARIPLERIALDAIPPATLFAVHRTRVTDAATSEDAFVEEARRVLSQP